MAESFNRPHYLYPVPVAGYHPYYPVIQPAIQPAYNQPSTMPAQMEVLPEQEALQEQLEIIGPPSNPHPVEQKSDVVTGISSPQIEHSIPLNSAAVEAAGAENQKTTADAARKQTPTVPPPASSEVTGDVTIMETKNPEIVVHRTVSQQASEDNHPFGTHIQPSPLLPSEEESKDVTPPVANWNDSGASNNRTAIEESRTVETDKTTLRPAIDNSPSRSTIKPDAAADRSIPTPSIPSVIELSLAEKLSQSQPLIEEAIKNGNFAEAYYLWRPLADAGDPSAQYGIGWMYHNGYGLSINDQKAYEWWGKAAAQNYVEAIFSIGTLYQFGYGPLNKDTKIALSYYLMATVAGHDESRLILKTMLEQRDSSIKPVLSALLLYYLNSAISGDNDSRTQLKQMVLHNDSRIAEILPKLLSHYRDSAISGDKDSQQVLRTLMLSGDKRAEGIVAELLQSHPKILGNIPATVHVKRANTRMGPGTQHKIIKVLKQGDELMVIDREGGWLLTQLSGSDAKAWISTRLVTLNP